MRVGIDARPLQHLESGIGTYVHNVLKILVASDEFEFFLYSDGPLAHCYGRAAVRSIGRRFRGLGSLFSQLLFPLWARRDNLDCFWSPRHHLPLLPGGMPSVVTVHDLVWLKVPETMAFGAVFLERLLMPRALERADQIIAVSRATARDLEEEFPKLAGKVEIIPLAAKRVERTLYCGPESPFALFVGTIEPRKNLARLIDAFAVLHATGELSLDLHVVGGWGWKSAELRRRIESANYPWLVFRGTLTDRELAAEYSGCKFLVAPSLYEGFGLPLLEAMSFGKAVITSSVSSMPEVVGAGGILVNPLSVEEIGSAIVRLDRDNAFREQLEGVAMVLSAQREWSDVAAETKSVLYRSLDQ